MPQARDEAGNIWETDAQGNPVRLISQAQAPADPTFEFQGPQAAADLERTQAATSASRASAASSYASAAASGQTAQGRALENVQKAQEIENWRESQNAKEVRQFLRFDRNMQIINRARDMVTQNGGVGWSSLLRSLPDNNARDLESALKPLLADLGFDRLQEMRDASPTGGALGQVSERELDLLQSSMGNLDLGASKDQFLRNLDMVQQQLVGVYASAGGATGADWDGRVSALSKEYRPTLPRDEDEGAPGIGQATDSTFATPDDLDVQRQVQSAFNGGATTAELVDLQTRLGRPVSEGQRAVIEQNVQARDAGLPVRSIPVPESGVQSSFRKGLNEFIADSPNFTGYGAGAANALSLGFSDEIAGTLSGVGSDYANRAKGFIQDQAPGAYLGGEFSGGLIGGAVGGAVAPNLARLLTSTAPRAAATGALYGGISGAGEMNDSRLIGAGGGAFLGGLGGYGGQRLGTALARKIGGVGGSQSARNVQAVTGGAQDFRRSFSEIEEARGLGLPMTLADTDPLLRSNAGSATRINPEALRAAEPFLDQRGRSQADRLAQRVTADLAPIDDVSGRMDSLRTLGNQEASAFYARARNLNAPDDAELNELLNTPAGKRAMQRAYEIASNERRNPEQLGFVYDPASGSVSINQAGRYVNPTRVSGNEKNVERGGPDLVGFLRKQGGLNRSSARGDLDAMGIDNRQRSGDFVGQEVRWGPLVSDNGLNLDDAATRAFEAGYFPELDSPPDNATFLNALRDTWEGSNRRFLPEDQAKFDLFNSARADRLAGREAAGAGQVVDNSVSAGPRPFAPNEAFGQEVGFPTYETLHYVKRGLDSVVEGERDQFGKLNLSDDAIRSVNDLRKDLVARLGELNPDYRLGNEAFQRRARQRDALHRGYETLWKNNVREGDVGRAIDDSVSWDNRQIDGQFDTLPMLRSGYASRMVDQGNQARLSANPWEAVYGGGQQQQRVGQLFPEGAGRFNRAYNLERQMAKTGQEVLGGSQTASRQAADSRYSGGLGHWMLGAGMDATATGGAMTAGNALRAGIRGLREAASVSPMAQRRAMRDSQTLLDPNISPEVLAEATSLLEREARLGRILRPASAFAGIFGAPALLSYGTN